MSIKKVKDHLMKAQSALDKLHESVGAGRTKAQKEAVKKAPASKKKEVMGGEVANRKLAAKRKPGRPAKKK